MLLDILEFMFNSATLFTISQTSQTFPRMHRLSDCRLYKEKLISVFPVVKTESMSIYFARKNVAVTQKVPEIM